MPVVLLAAILAQADRAAAAATLYARASRCSRPAIGKARRRRYRELLKAQPSKVAARSNLGVVWRQLGRYEEAIEAYRAALAVDPKQQQGPLNLGIALYKAARATAMRSPSWPRCATAEPDNLQARYLEADCHLRMGALPASSSSLAPIEPARQDDQAFAYMLGLALLQEKEMEKGRRARRPHPQAGRIGGGALDAGHGQAGRRRSQRRLEALGRPWR